MNKLYQGDCIKILKRLKSESVDCVITDPPYRLTSRGGNSTLGGMYQEQSTQRGKVFSNNDIEIEDYLPELYRVLKDGTHCYIMCNNTNLIHFLSEIDKSEFHFIKALIWEKGNKISGNKYMSSYEFILFLSKGKNRFINNCGTPDILKVNSYHTKDQQGNNIHHSQKPTELMRILIENSTNRGELVLDPFMGSGTTGIACVNTERDFVGIEIDDKYFELARRRIEGTPRQLSLF